MRKSKILAAGWKFSPGLPPDSISPDFNDSLWENVRVPHDWAVKGPFSQFFDAQITRIENNGENTATLHLGRTGGLPHTGTAVYRRKINVPASDEGRSFRLEFDGVMSHAKIYVNGKFAGERPYGYSSFAVDATPMIRPGKDNLVAVTVDNPSDSSRWYPGAGIYRHVRFLSLDPEHIPFHGVWIRTRSVSDNNAELSIHVESSSGFRFEITAPDGSLAASGHGADGMAEFVLTDRILWDVDAPCLYRAAVILDSGDRVEVPFGIRTVSFDPDHGMTLNGRPFKMNGVCLHHDLGPLGAAFRKVAAVRQLKTLKSIGVNAIRMTHNPPDPAMLDACDELGLLAIDEAFDCWQMGKVTNDYHTLFDEWHERDLVDMIRRDRNHPSVILWSIGNEILEQTLINKPELARHLVDLAHRADPDRKVTAGLSFDPGAIDSGIAAELDVPGFNYKPHRYELYHKQLPAKPIYGSENASTVSSRDEYYFPLTDGDIRHDTIQSSSFDIEFPPWGTNPDKEFHFQDRCPWIMGQFVWTGFDYLGEPWPYDNAWPAHASYFGIFDLVGLPKDRAYLYQSQWSSDPVLHILPHWNFPARIGVATPVHVYSNFDDVELFLNGKSQGRKRINGDYRFCWDFVLYEPGELKAVAYAPDGSIAMTAFRKTAETAQLIDLQLEEKRTLKSDGEDLLFLRVAATDCLGNVDPLCNARIQVKIDGPARIAGIGNGDAACLDTFQASSIHLFHGRAVIYLEAVPGTEGDAVVHVSSEAFALNAPSLSSIHISIEK